MPTTTNFGWTTPADTDYVKDGALAIRTLGNGIDTSLVDLKGGTSGQVLAKNSNTDMDFVWVAQDDSNAIQNAIIDAKGDLISATAADTPARLASSGVNGDVLTVDTTTATGLKWAAPAGGGKVLQVVQATYSTSTAISSTTFTDTGLSVSITPSSASSKVLIMVAQKFLLARTAAPTDAYLRIIRGATSVQDFGKRSAHIYATPLASEIQTADIWSPIYLDSPSTTSSTTYKTQAKLEDTGSSHTITMQYNSDPSVIIAMEIGA